jgi:hypothetical protein|tara:strand:- start:62 stop:769 length:708 start_codon:yes stop_codon:yes gene_type:complete
MSENNKVSINISGYGGECVIGSISKEQYDYWKALDNSELADYAQGSEEYVSENKIPKDMDFLEGDYWFDCDNIAHVYGCDMESSSVEIDLPNDTTLSYDSPYEILRKYEEAEDGDFDDIGKDYCYSDECIREQRECYTDGGLNYCYDKGHYFTSYASEKGGFISCEFDLPEGHTFDERRLVFDTFDLDGDSILETICYIFPDDDPNDPTELENYGPSTNGKGWECNLFEITRPEE